MDGASLTLTAEEAAELAYFAAHGRRALGIAGKRPVEHKVDDHLWERGWVVMSRVPPDERAPAKPGEYEFSIDERGGNHVRMDRQ